MKKLLAAVLALAMAGSMTACSFSVQTPSSESSGSSSSAASSDASSSSSSSSSSSNVESTTETPEKVAVDKMKEIEGNDTFKVQVTKKELRKDAFSGMDGNLNGKDAIILTVENKTDKPISKVAILVLAYNDQNEAQIIKSGLVSSFGSGDKYIKSFVTKDDVTIAAGKSEEIAVQTTLDSVTGVRAIVESYTQDGKEVKNDLASEWYKNAYEGKSTVVD